tara:strand:- start:83 stop:496 length:414 start_codon:yes stop_codon:yes gene_type:complete
MQVNDKKLKRMIDNIKKELANSTNITKQQITKELKPIKDNAKKNWPVRQKRFGPSKGSGKKITTTIKTKNNLVIGSIANSAPYAWAIKAGENSKTNVKRGKIVADVLFYQPAIKAADKIAKNVANGLMNNVKKVRNG